MAFIRNTPNNNGRRHNNNGPQRPRYNNGGGGNNSYNNQSNYGAQRKPSSRLNQVFDSNTPDARVRGTALQIVEKYQGLARDAQSSGDRVLAQSYQQHAEHYQRLHNEILEEHTAIEAERNAWRQSQQQTYVDQNDGSNEELDAKMLAQPVDNKVENRADNVTADNTVHVPRPRPQRQPRPEGQAPQQPRYQAPAQDTMDAQELPSFLSIPIRATQTPKVAKPAETNLNHEPAAPLPKIPTLKAPVVQKPVSELPVSELSEIPLVEAVVTRPRRTRAPTVTVEE